MIVYSIRRVESKLFNWETQVGSSSVRRNELVFFASSKNEREYDDKQKMVFEYIIYRKRREAYKQKRRNKKVVKKKRKRPYAASGNFWITIRIKSLSGATIISFFLLRMRRNVRSFVGSRSRTQ